MSKRFGRYELIEKLGRGGMGDVWLARDPKLGREVAIKTIRHEADSPDADERFLREARAAAQCRHRGIVTIFDFGVQDGEPFLVMERIPGRTLHEHLAAEGPLPTERAMQVGSQIAAALAHAHALGVLHRDITPGNVLLDEDGTARVLDFGLVRDVGSPTSELSANAMLGTPSYLAPEQAFGAPEEVDARADIYGLGATLFTALTGKPPFAGPTLLALLRNIEDQDVPPTGREPAVDALLARALAKDREERFASAEAFGQALRNWRATPCEARPSAAVALDKPSRQRASLAWLAAGIAALIGLGYLLVQAFATDGTDTVRQGVDARAFDLPHGPIGEDARLEHIASGRFGDAAAMRPIASLDGWVALMLGSPASLRRYVNADAFRMDTDAPAPIPEDTAAAAGMQVLDGDALDALEAIDELRDRRGPEVATPDLDWIEAHALLSVDIDDFDEHRANELLTRLLEEHRDHARNPQFASGIVDLLRQRTGFDEPVFFDREDRGDALERDLVATALFVGTGEFDAACAIAEDILADDRSEPWALAHLAWLRMIAALEQQRALELGDLVAPLRALVADEDLPARYPAAVVLAVHALLVDDLATAAVAARAAAELLEEDEHDPDHLPHPIGGILEDHEAEPTLVAQAQREVLEAFGLRVRAATLGRRIAASAATDLDEEPLRQEVLAENALALARCTDNRSERVAFVLQAIEHGADEGRLRDDEQLESLLDLREIRARLDR